MKAGTTDRYLSFKNIDCEGNSKKLIQLLRRHIDDPEKSNAFWEQFKTKLALVGKPEKNGGRCLDELFLIHTYINNFYEIFETYEDNEALELLERIERECC